MPISYAYGVMNDGIAFVDSNSVGALFYSNECPCCLVQERNMYIYNHTCTLYARASSCL